ncbi:MAG TPA: ubiquinone/menaquinone biosynthesis methyltransferase [Candidatus Eisenbacteria bacterium]|nr:ubiquinone/menaquinone biosynthesis methyltransferase [Candidatus Eisenbacteria bacterium]
MAPAWIRPWPRDRATRRAYVDDVFRRVAPQYDRLTRLLSFGQDDRWKSTLVGLLPDGSREMRVLDLATGTAAFPLLLRNAGHRGTIVGVDRSRAMLRRGRAKCAEDPRIRFVESDLNALPFSPGTFDVILIGYGLRYLDDLGESMRAAHRVLRPGGVLLSLDFGLPARRWYRTLCLTYLFVFGTIWGLLLHRRADTYWHIVESLRAYPGQEALERAILDAGFARVAIVEQLGGISVLARAERAAGAARSAAAGEERVDGELDAFAEDERAAGAIAPPRVARRR